MNRRTFLTLGLALSLPASLAWAETAVDDIQRQLKAQGYTRIEVTRTLLGRSRIVASKPDVQREIIVNPVTGEILRDFWQGRSGSTGGGLLDPSPQDDDDGGKGRGRGRGRGGDESGSGRGGNSGSGGGDDSGGDDGGGDDGGGGNSGSGGGSGDGDD